MFKKMNEQNKDKIIYNKEYNLSELKEICNENKFKTNLPVLSRLISKLINEGYLKEWREGRMKYISF